MGMYKRILFRISVLLLILAFAAGISGCSHSGEEDKSNVEATQDLEHSDPEEEQQEKEQQEKESETGNDESEETGETEEKNADDEPDMQVPDETFVNVKVYLPDIFVELKYATTDNFTGQKIYDFSDAYLRFGTVKKLMQVQEQLKQGGFSLKIWDAFRPVSAQFTLWNICPNATYVANPNQGYSSHSRGNTVDITIVRDNGEEIPMPSGFDDFSARADRDYSDCGLDAAKNAQELERLMTENGFRPYAGEWWHYTDEEDYPVEEVFCPE